MQIEEFSNKYDNVDLQNRHLNKQSKTQTIKSSFQILGNQGNEYNTFRSKSKMTRHKEHSYKY